MRSRLSPRTSVSIANVNRFRIREEAPERRVVVHVPGGVEVDEPPMPVTTRIITAESGIDRDATSTFRLPTWIHGKRRALRTASALLGLHADELREGPDETRNDSATVAARDPPHGPLPRRRWMRRAREPQHDRAGERRERDDAT
jgi:hypothetical protein